MRDEGRRGEQVKTERLKGIEKEPTRREDFKELQESRQAEISLGEGGGKDTHRSTRCLRWQSFSSPMRHLHSEPPSLPQILAACYVHRGFLVPSWMPPLLQAADQHRTQRRHPHAKPLLQGHMAMKHTSHTLPARCLRSQLSLGKPERLSNHGDCGRKS